MNSQSFEKMWVRSEEIRQFVYCKRKPFFRKFMNYRPPMSVKMREGINLHEKVTIKQLKNQNDREYFNLWIEDEEEKLIAVIDKLVIFEEKDENKKEKTDGKEKLKGKIVEFKTGIKRKRIEYDQKAQLIIQAIVAEKKLNIEVTKIAVEKTDGTLFVEEELTWEAKSWGLAKVKELRKIISRELIPEPPKNEKKCTDCECWKVCLRA